jgi:hypothetical protein
MLNNSFRKDYLTIALGEVLGGNQLTAAQASKSKLESKGKGHVI